MSFSKFDQRDRFEFLATLCEFHPGELGGEIPALLRPYRLLALTRQSPAPDSEKLAGLSVQLLWPGEVLADEQAAQCCLAGLYLYHDHWERAHRLAQDIATREGSYWHAIVHRREPDAWNSKYWFRRVGEHPIFAPLSQVAQRLAEENEAGAELLLRMEGTWDPLAFVDLCDKVRDSGTAAERFCRDLQMCEWMLLMKYCAERAIEKTGR